MGSVVKSLPSNSRMVSPGMLQEPLFSRESNSDIEELRACYDHVTDLMHQCSNLEHINADLERRLERQARERLAIDGEIVQANRAWEGKLHQAAAEAAKYRSQFEKEVRLGNIAREKLRRTERELFQILQKKYDIVRMAKSEERAEISDRDRIHRELSLKVESASVVSSNLNRQTIFNPKGESTSAVREEQMLRNLADFFCM